MLFFIGLLCMSWKKPFSAKQENFITSKLYELHSKPFLRTTTSFCTCLSSLSAKNSHFHKPKVFLLHKTFLNSHPKQLFSTLRHPFALSLTYCPPKNTAILLIFALILCCKAGASHRFKSLPAIPGEVAAFRKTGYLMIAGHFRKNTLSTGDLNRPRSPEVRKPLVYSPFFSYTRKE